MIHLLHRRDYRHWVKKNAWNASFQYCAACVIVQKKARPVRIIHTKASEEKGKRECVPPGAPLQVYQEQDEKSASLPLF